MDMSAFLHYLHAGTLIKLRRPIDKYKMRDEDFGGSRNAFEQDLRRHIDENPQKVPEW